MEELELSIIIPTFGRTTELELLLKSIVNSHLSISYEIIIVDQNDHLIDNIVKNYEAFLPIKHCKVSFRGLSKAKNYGIKISRGHIICFPDDDAEFRQDTILTALKLLQDKDVDCIFGKCVEKGTDRDTVITFKKYEMYLSLQDFEGAFVEATMFALKDILIKYNYDEQMGVGTIFGSQEGYDLVYRMLCDGCKLFYSPQIIFFHPNKISRRESVSEICRAFYYSCGLGYLCRKHSFKKMYKRRLRKIRLALPLIFLLKHKQYKYFKAQMMGLQLGYSYLQ